jgi:hypothetical protein
MICPTKKMMKKLLIVFIITFSCSLTSFSQVKGDIRLGMYGQALSFRDQMLPQFGLVGEYFLNHNFSMNYRYGIGYNSNGGVMGHINLSLLGIAYAASMSSSEELLWSLMIPEGFSYHAYPNDFVEISPYINPLGSEINLYENTSIMLSCAFGMNIHFKPVVDFSFSPNLGAIIMYGNGEIVPTFGFSISYKIKD